MNSCDVIIVGGGHVGLYTAWRLAEQGLSVALFEQKSAIGERIVCTGIIGTEAFRRFDLPRETLIGEIRDLRFFTPSGNSFDYDSPELLAEVVDRGAFNRALASRASDAGASIHTGARIENIRVKKEEVLVHVSKGEAGENIYHAKLLILSTGVNYKLFHAAGLEMPRQFLGGAQVQIPYRHEEKRTLVFFGRELAPGAFAWVVPLKSQIARVGLLAETTPALYLKRILDRVMPGWRDDLRESQFDLRPVVQKPMEKSFGERVLVVGEAAGQIKTTTGGGIYYGLLGADCAIQTIEAAFQKDNFSSNLLSSYDRRWKKLIGDELRFGYYCRSFFAKLSDAQMEDFFNRLIQEKVSAIASRKAAFDWHRNFLLSVFKLPAIRETFRSLF